MSEAEDIINRRGATLSIALCGPGADGSCDPNKGDRHAVRGEGGDVLIAEVSTGNDDRTDNWFRDPIDRLAEIGEDVEPLHPLVSDCDSRLAQARPVAAAIDASHWLWHPPFDQRGPK